MTPEFIKAHLKVYPSANEIDRHSELQQVTRHSSSSALRRYLLPCALCSLACLLAAVLMVADTSRTWALLRGAPELKRHSATWTSPDAAVRKGIQQLQKAAQQNHEEVVDLLFDIKMGQQKVPIVPRDQLVSSSYLADTVVAADHEEDEAADLSAATAAAPETGYETELAAAEVPAALSALPLLTTLHNNLLRHSQEFLRHRSIMQQILNQLVHMSAAAAQVEVQDRLDSGSLEPVEEFTYELYKLMLASEKLIPCREDSTLVVGDTISLHDSSTKSSSSSSSSSSKSARREVKSSSGDEDSRLHSSSSVDDTTFPKYYFATNLRDNSIQMPHYTLSLLQTLLHLPRDSVFVSVYESNSDDGMQGWIDVLQLALDVIGTHNRVVTRGMLVRTGEQDRIHFLAQVRNMAMAPLYSHYTQQQSQQATDTKGYPNSSPSDGINSGTNAGPGALPWDPDYIVFINDVYFCWGMVLRLMNYRADITCGTDWNQHSGNTDSLPSNSPYRNKALKSKPQIPPELKLEAPIPEALAPDQENPINFYDTWVARDIAGAKFWWRYPYIKDKNSSVVTQQGLPVRASCCWNGLAVLRAEPFKRGVRFRMHQEGECRASECSLMCDDFARLGYKEVVVDTGVQLAYDYNLAREIMAVGIEGVGLSTWAQVKAAGISQAHRQPAYQRMECCGKRPGEDMVRFKSDCGRRNVMRRNYTLSALQMSRIEWAI